MPETLSASAASLAAKPEHTFVHRILRYAPSALRDEWVNIGVLIFDPQTGARRLRVIEEEEEYRRVRRLLPRADEALLRNVRDDLENQLAVFHQRNTAPGDWQKVLVKWDQTITNAVHFAAPKGTVAEDLDAELERLYADHVAVPRPPGRAG